MEIKHNRETALSISETRYRTLVETMGDGLSEIDENQVTTYANGRFKGSFAVITDISKQKKEKDLLEMRVKERTIALEYKTKSLEDMNTALRVLLKKREQDRHILEEQMSLNVRELVLPYVQRLGKTHLDDIQKDCLDMMESTLNEIVSPFLQNLPLAFLHLTPSEIQVANLVKHGKTTKDIAQILNLSGKTIEFYRKRIRKKVGITNKQINLRTFLNTPY